MIPTCGISRRASAVNLEHMHPTWAQHFIECVCGLNAELRQPRGMLKLRREH